LNQKTLTQKVSTITKIVTDIKHEIEVLRTKITTITVEIGDCTRKVTTARESVTTLMSKLAGLTSASKAKGTPKEKAAIEKEMKGTQSELESAKNVATVED